MGMPKEMSANEYKAFHESFMKNNNGTNFWHVMSVILPTALTTFLTIIVYTTVNKNMSRTYRFFVEFLILVIPVILSVTIWSDKLNSLIYTLMIIDLPVIAKLVFSIFKNTKKDTNIFAVEIPTGNREFISIVRAIINLLTAVCILAVDFQIFPRKFAKTENYGFSLMDTGVGLYVFGNAIIAPEIYKQSQLKPPLSRFKSQLVGTIPLLILGAGRFIIVKEIDYQEHISEYGVHWNFFITLAITKLLGTTLLLVIPIKNLLLSSLLISILHEILLSYGLSSWVLSDTDRNSFLTANREGIASISGYVALYLISVHLGEILYVKSKDIRANISCIVKLTCYALLFNILTLIYHKHFGVSRRLANFGYLTFVLSLSVSMSVVFLIMELLLIVYTKSNNEVFNANNYIPTIFKSINYNGLLYFLIANLGTGLINLSTRTLLVPEAPSLFIIATYMFVITGFVQVLMMNKIKLKIW